MCQVKWREMFVLPETNHSPFLFSAHINLQFIETDVFRIASQLPLAVHICKECTLTRICCCWMKYHVFGIFLISSSSLK
ncbi:hypothetical protein XELAEV_18009225mg [Xenopus laevis]|uniref:Uncharacterized protein n=1 Tax=Xenopus laevis TaxID=8355 RepID=A0A974DRZ5_XENLA|nr:hypothetical protein XELAEV_18009225mg [Xenopus laevis]